MARRQLTRKSGRDSSDGLQDEVLSIRVHNKVTKGGRTISFGAMVAVGDGRGRVGLGYGKARGVPMAIEKAIKEAKRQMIRVPMIGDTICHVQVGEHKSSRVLLRPAAPGTGVKAGSTVRNMMQVMGVHNVLTKSLGRNNPINLAKAAFEALSLMCTREQVEELRGVRVALRHPQIAKPKAAAVRQAAPQAVAPEAPQAVAPEAPQAAAPETVAPDAPPTDTEEQAQ